MIEAVLCDIDGTLLQSNWLHAAAWKDAFAQIDIDVPLEDVRRQIGKGGDELIPVFVPWWKRKAVEQPLKRYREFIFRDQYLSQVEPFPKVRELLQHMKQAGIKISLASSAHQEELEDYKRIANIEDLVEASSSSDDASRSKPHPDIFEATLKKLGVASKNALALGDTPYDTEAAGKANVWTAGVTTGGWTEAELLAAGCIEVYRDVAELLENFEHSAFAK
ncbi:MULTISPECIES: HAD family hydrolase [Acidobacteriaceae]|uniref:HAD family hydrolase n=1 Tax=Acidobacteriaceae TaxID=204434 RepID=UPI00131AA19E|nr:MULTISPECIES: HAD family hydrolase [Acidobacteriaceae]MDW5266836.1 HAD family hydrolase [Edaphobacter sp.]